MPAPLGFMFDARTVEPTAPMGAVPAGTYNVQLAESKSIPVSSDPTQSQHELVFEIIDGQYKGRKGWVYLNLNNPDAQKRGMAHGDLSAICRAANVIQLMDMEQLIGRPMTCDFKLVKGTEQYPDDKNRLRNFKPYAGPAQAAPAMGAPAGFAPPMAPVGAPVAPAPMPPQAFAPAPAPLAPPPTMPQGFGLPGQQTAPAPQYAPAAPVPMAPAFAPPMAPGFAPPAPPAGMPAAPAWGTVPGQA